MFQLEWSPRQIQKGSSNHVAHLVAYLLAHLVAVRMRLGLQLFHLSLYPPSASPTSGPGMHFVTKCPGLFRTAMLSRSRQQVLAWVSIHPHEFHHILAFLHFTSIFPSQLPALWTLSFSIRHKDNYVTKMTEPAPTTVSCQIPKTNLFIDR